MYEDNDATGINTDAAAAPSSAALDGQPAETQAEPEAAQQKEEFRSLPTETDDLPEDAINTGGQTSPGKSDAEILAQFDRIEAKLDQVIEMLRPGAQTSAKVPYVAPEQPAGLSPNQILATAQAISQPGAE